jgi:hypothetical protein
MISSMLSVVRPPPRCRTTAGGRSPGGSDLEGDAVTFVVMLERGLLIVTLF